MNLKRVSDFLNSVLSVAVGKRSGNMDKRLWVGGRGERGGGRGGEERREGRKEGMRGGSEGGILASQWNDMHLKPSTDLGYRVGSALTTSFFNILQSLMIFRAPIAFICRASLLERKERRREEMGGGGEGEEEIGEEEEKGGGGGGDGRRRRWGGGDGRGRGEGRRRRRWGGGSWNLSLFQMNIL